jgi:hypothetical protein
LFGDYFLSVKLVNSICGGITYPSTSYGITIITYLLSSKPNIYTCLAPFGSYVLSPPLRIKWIPISSGFTTNVGGMQYVFVK